MKTVLIIDDDPISNYLSEQLFFSIKRKLKVHTITEVQKALQFLKDFDYSHLLLIFVDIHLPGMSGFEVIKKLTSIKAIKHNFLKIIMYSSSITEKDINSARKLGVYNVIEKPLTKEEILPLMDLNTSISIQD